MPMFLGLVQHFLTRVGLLVPVVLQVVNGRALEAKRGNHTGLVRGAGAEVQNAGSWWQQAGDGSPPPNVRAGSGCNQGTGSGRGPDSKRPAIRLRRLAYSSLFEADRYIRALSVTVMVARTPHRA
jgi:hypothetical protein